MTDTRWGYHTLSSVLAVHKCASRRCAGHVLSVRPFRPEC
jgi:hypothetical protein